MRDTKICAKCHHSIMPAYFHAEQGCMIILRHVEKGIEASGPGWWNIQFMPVYKKYEDAPADCPFILEQTVSDGTHANL